MKSTESLSLGRTIGVASARSSSIVSLPADCTPNLSVKSFGLKVETWLSRDRLVARKIVTRILRQAGGEVLGCGNIHRVGALLGLQ